MLNLIMHSDIGSDAVQDVLRRELGHNPKHLFLTSTMVLKAMRGCSVCESCVDNLYSFAEYERSLTPVIFKNKDCLSNTEQRYLLALVIDELFQDDEVTHNTFQSIRRELYELFNSLNFNEAIITYEAVQDIAADYSVAESKIFELYRRYMLVVNDIIAMSNGRATSGEVDGIIKALPINTDKPLHAYQEKKKIAIQESISAVDALFFDGFLFFDDIQKYVIKHAIESKKEVFVISKQFSDGSGAFIVEDAIKSLANEIGCKVNVVLSEHKLSGKNTALGFARATYPSVFGQQLEMPAFEDGSIRFIEPFINRDVELRFVVKSISDRIRENYNGELSSIISVLSETAIIAAVNKEKYEQRISDLFAEVGAFVRKDNLPDSISKDDLPEVCFSKADYIAAEIKGTSGENLTLSDKLRLFDRCYHKIEINKHGRPISTYPIGQFVLRIYEIATLGMSTEAFKCIMFSNWRYSQKIAEQKWSDFIADFQILEVWFENQKDIRTWKETAKNFLNLREEIKDNPLYGYHPLNAVREESLHVLLNLIEELEHIVKAIQGTNGRISEHIAVLQDVVIKKCAFDDTDELTQEQGIVKRISDTVAELKDNSLIGNVSASYFAENIRSMLTEYESEMLDETSPLSISVVNLENMRSYKTCYFIMCEAGKYPRPYIEQFPYTEDMSEILSDEKYGIKVMPSNRFGLQYHLNLERYLLKNVLDFTTDELIITHTESEAGTCNTISLFAKSLAAIFGEEISYEQVASDDRSVSGESQRGVEPVYLPRKDNYTVTELAIFKLCPRLYFHRRMEQKSCFVSRLQLHFYAEAVLYCDLLRRFMDYNLNNKAVYSDDDDTYFAIIEKLHQECVGENRRFFGFLSNYELSDISRNAISKMLSSIENSKQYIDGHTFTLIPYNDAVYEGNGYTITVEHDNRFVDYEKKSWRMSQSTSYVEFLVMKTNDRKSELVHYKDMVEALDRNDSNEDRINLTSRILAKINIQFDSKRFAADGVKRVDSLVEEVGQYDFAKAVAMPSNYCTYCRYNAVCLGK